MAKVLETLRKSQLLPIIDRLLLFSLGMDLERLIKVATFTELDQSPQEQYRTNVIIAISIITSLLVICLVLFGIVGISFNLFDDIPNRIVTLFIVPIAYLVVIIFALRFPWQHKIQRLTQITISSTLLAIMIATYFSGGLFGTPIMGLIIVFIIGIMLLNYRSVVLLYCMMIVYLFVLLVADLLSILPPLPANNLPVQMIGLIAAFTSSFILITYYKYAIQASERKIASLQNEMVRLETQQDITRALTHDLRTPLSVLKSNTYIINKKQEKNKAIDDNVKVIDDTVNHMTMIIEDLLELTVLDAKTSLQYKDYINLEALFSQILEQVRPLTESKNITLTYTNNIHPDVMVLGHPEQLCNALLNIVENAIQFNIADGTVSIRTQQHTKTIVIDITDTGIGIAPESKDRIFERFFKVDQARTVSEHKGTGVGLSITQQIIRLHHGTIDVQSTMDRGTSIIVTLPIASK